MSIAPASSTILPAYAVVDRIAGAPVRIVQTIATQIIARTDAIDPRDGRISLPTATLAAPLPSAKHGLPQPGTFALLLVAPKP